MSRQDLVEARLMWRAIGDNEWYRTLIFPSKGSPELLVYRIYRENWRWSSSPLWILYLDVAASELQGGVGYLAYCFIQGPRRYQQQLRTASHPFKWPAWPATSASVPIARPYVFSWGILILGGFAALFVSEKVAKHALDSGKVSAEIRTSIAFDRERMRNSWNIQFWSRQSVNRRRIVVQLITFSSLSLRFRDSISLILRLFISCWSKREVSVSAGHFVSILFCFSVSVQGKRSFV